MQTKHYPTVELARLSYTRACRRPSSPLGGGLYFPQRHAIALPDERL